jgi:hypothetical protein
MINATFGFLASPLTACSGRFAANPGNTDPYRWVAVLRPSARQLALPLLVPLLTPRPHLASIRR